MPCALFTLVHSIRCEITMLTMAWTTELIAVVFGLSALVAIIVYLATKLSADRKIAKQEYMQEQVQQQFQQQISTLQTEQSRLQLELQAAQINAEQKQQQYQDAINQREQLQQKLDKQQTLYQQLQAEDVALKTSLAEKEQHHQQQLEQLEHNKKQLSESFENLANKIFEEKGKSFNQNSQQHIDQMLKPFREQISGFQKRVNDVHESSIKTQANLNAEIQKVLDIGLKMSKEANDLTHALKGDSQQRGAWGEAQLKRTLEMSGLIEDAHYESQTAFKDAEGKRKQTDYLIKLPDNKHIIIDSKVSLVAYEKAMSSDNDATLKLAMNEHVQSVKGHIDDLASKDYTNLAGIRSPSFVLMFMPIEPAYIDALKHNQELFNYGYEKGIVLVSHTTLIPILRTVANLWIMERSTAEAREISEKAGDIYNQVCLVAERLQKLGGTLQTVSNHYNGTVKALVGQQGLHGKVERFREVSNKVSKKLVEIEPTHLDFETERLVIAAEPIPDSAQDITKDQE